MALLVKRRWFWGALAGSLAFLVWQPFGIYAVVAVVAAGVAERWRGVRNAVAGAAIPLVATTVWLWIAGSLGDAVESTISYPLGGVERAPETLGGRISHIASEVSFGYGLGGLLLAAGLVALVAIVVLRVRSAWVLVATLLPLVLFSLHDFQGAPDVFPFLPYAAIGLAAVGALALGRVRSPRGPRSARWSSWRSSSSRSSPSPARAHATRDCCGSTSAHCRSNAYSTPASTSRRSATPPRSSSPAAARPTGTSTCPRASAAGGCAMTSAASAASGARSAHATRRSW